MRLKKKGSLLLFLLLVGCATVDNKKPPLNEPSSDASIKLAEAANSVSNSLLELAKIETAFKPVHDKPLVKGNIYNLQSHAAVDWSGPIEPLVKHIAKASHYRARILGTPPAIPVLISVSEKDTTFANLLRNIDYQAGKKANIKVYPNVKTIELRYAKS